MHGLSVAAAAACLALLAGPAASESAEARGKYLVEGLMGCGNCHTPLGPQGFEADLALGGRLVEKNEMFTAVAPNITPGGRVAEWSDAELAVAIREGRRPDGSIIGPPMPFAVYRGISDDDLAAVVAYLRSVPAVSHDPGVSDYKIPLPPAYGPPVEAVMAPEPGVSVDYGGYLVALAHCMECHSPMTPQGPDLAEGLGRGGFVFHGPWGTSVAANITNHADGLAGYSDAELKMMITEGRRADGGQMLPPMPYSFLAKASEADLDAMVMYLRTVPGQPDP
ncbi:cytochrome c [Roseivivax sp. GX 12232]|uniref:cytochrome c n=1 Tax=Roseivivax sp. GX 12232 TaxID=2900547 RepID=UPI001E64CDAC|nr:cytochrome c [Roseivivax sp. GX 12232]MCE0506638.1 cytochrome c [Roseivivax sp. GX 12232]